MINFTYGFWYEVLYSNFTTQGIPIFVLPPAPTVESVKALRVIAERKADPGLYDLTAKMFDVVDMPSAAASMRRRASHYRTC